MCVTDVIELSASLTDLLRHAENAYPFEPSWEQFRDSLRKLDADAQKLSATTDLAALGKQIAARDVQSMLADFEWAQSAEATIEGMATQFEAPGLALQTQGHIAVMSSLFSKLVAAHKETSSEDQRGVLFAMIRRVGDWLSEVEEEGKPKVASATVAVLVACDDLSTKEGLFNSLGKTLEERLSGDVAMAHLKALLVAKLACSEAAHTDTHPEAAKHWEATTASATGLLSEASPKLIANLHTLMMTTCAKADENLADANWPPPALASGADDEDWSAFVARSETSWYGYKKGNDIMQLVAELDAARASLQSAADIFSNTSCESDLKHAAETSEKIQALVWAVKAMRELLKPTETTAKRQRVGSNLLIKLDKKRAHPHPGSSPTRDDCQNG